MIETARLLLRRWRPEDRVPFAVLNGDPEVMEHFPAPLTPPQSDFLVDRIETEFDQCGFGLWAVEVRATGEFIGFTGMARQTFDAPFNPSVEVGWRMARSAWGHGYATEAATAAITDFFARTDVSDIISMTATTNLRSQAVMQRLGLTHDPADDFDHPRVPDGPLKRHVLYRLHRDDWS